MNSVELNVPGISCSHCVHTIEMELAELAGVIEVKVDQEAKQVSVDFEPPATEETISDLMEEINYPISASGA